MVARGIANVVQVADDAKVIVKWNDLSPEDKAFALALARSFILIHDGLARRG